LEKVRLYTTKSIMYLIVCFSLVTICACSSANNKRDKLPSNAQSSENTKTIGCKNKLLVYPPNDGFGGSLSQGASGKPSELCDENNLLKQNPGAGTTTTTDR
jgi:hypothetical protein